LLKISLPSHGQERSIVVRLKAKFDSEKLAVNWAYGSMRQRLIIMATANFIWGNGKVGVSKA
jgi:hypothetical protein